MQEVTSPEGPKRKELITPDAIKRRVMEFFKDVDLKELGEKQVGLVTINTRSYPHVPEIVHQATLNGFRAAEYLHIPSDSNLEPLPEGKDRSTAHYVLRGITGNGEVSVWFTEYEKKPAEIKMAIPGNAMNSNNKNGPIQEFSDFDKRFVAELLGI